MPAYNYYTPTYGNPYSYYPQSYQPVVQPQVVAPQQSVQPQTVQQSQPFPVQTSILWVSNEKEASMYPVAPNNAVTLWSQSEPVVYLKQADATGKPSMKTYDLVERVSEAETASSSTVNSDYATKEELGKITGIVKGFSDLIESIKTDVDAMKGDMYGMAGRKKTVKKVDSDE